MGVNRLPEGNLDSLIDKSGINRVLILQWRDLDDPDAGGSEVHSHNIAEIWAAKGLQVTFRTSSVEKSLKSISRSGYTSVRSGGRYGVFIAAPMDVLTRRLGRFDALVEVWNGEIWIDEESDDYKTCRNEVLRGIRIIEKNHEQFGKLLRRCLSVKKTLRPSAIEIQKEIYIMFSNNDHIRKI